MLFLSRRLQPLRICKDDTLLEFFPQELTIIEVVQIIVIFVARQILAVLGRETKFEVGKTADNDIEYVLPELRLSMPMRIAERDLRKYATAVGQTDYKEIFQRHEQLCLILSAFSEPAFLLLLAHHRSPVRPVGSVNVKNRFELLRFDMCSMERMLDRVGYEARARMVPVARRVKRGLEIDLEVEVVDVEEDVVIFRQVFTTLQFMRFKRGVDQSRASDLSASQDSWPDDCPSKSFSIARELTMMWAYVCKDYNPIHSSRLAAKVLGFPDRLLHGNHAFAWALQAIPSSAEHEVKEVKSSVLVVEVQFKRPIVGSSKLVAEAYQAENGDSWLIRVCKAGDSKVYITGSRKRLE
ncbi:hypothetical protein LTR64_007531 [Lithohypha guttulata]|uniref:uncharacterized protein n=1 Tax=Lithohypha guttulata TaxID=1690604 RepID=UPI002DDFC32A|nr:hypothetical protein LTR51_007041 [Lithohypha guttulata]